MRKRTRSTACGGTTSQKALRCWRFSLTTWRSCRRCCRGRRRKAHRESTDSGNMRADVQRVSRARVMVEERVAGGIGAGWMILLGVGREDTSGVAISMAEKIAKLRIFADQPTK